MPRSRRSPISPAARTFLSFLKAVTAPSVFLPSPLFCHPELVVTRLCCQHFAVWQNARPARRLLLFPKISLRCDFREPCFSAQSNGSLFVISTSSSHAYAVSILPFSKTLDLQGGSSSSQKSRFAAIFGSPVIITRRVEKSCAVRIRRQAPLLRPRLPTTEKAGDEADE